MRLDVGIPSHIYYWANDTCSICANATKKHGKATKRLDNLKQHIAGYLYSSKCINKKGYVLVGTFI